MALSLYIQPILLILLSNQNTLYTYNQKAKLVVVTIMIVPVVFVLQKFKRLDEGNDRAHVARRRRIARRFDRHFRHARRAPACV